MKPNTLGGAAAAAAAADDRGGGAAAGLAILTSGDAKKPRSWAGARERNSFHQNLPHCSQSVIGIYSSIIYVFLLL